MQVTQLQENNVQLLPVSNVYTDIQLFLDQYKSKKTKTEYLRNIKEYFKFMYGKEINELIKKDVEFAPNSNEKLLMKDVDKYRNYLKEKHPNSDCSVLAKLSAIRSLFKYLSINGYKINPAVVNLKFLKSDPKSYDYIPANLIIPFSEKALEYKYAGKQLSVFILLAAQTSIRATALLKLQFKDIKYHAESGYYEVRIVDKGNKKRLCPIDQNVYNRISELGDNGLIFTDLKLDWVNKTIQKIASEFKELEGKRIVTHSLRKSAPSFSWATEKDIKQVVNQTGHSSIETAMKTYVDDSDTYQSRAGIKMFKKVDESVLEHITKDELIKMIKEMNYNVYHGILLKIQDRIKVG